MSSGAALVEVESNSAATAAPAVPAVQQVAALGDRELARRLRENVPGGFEDVVTAYQDRISRLAYRLLGWRAEVDDVVQDVLVAVLKHRRRFRGDASLWTWL